MCSRIEIKNKGVIKETHIKEFMKNLNGFRNSEMLCDFTLIVKDEERIPVHRVVMMACSEYIRTLLTYGTSDDKVDSARLPDLTSTGVQAVVAFAYTGELEMYEDTVLEVLAAASFLQVVGIVELCDKYLKREITIDNCVDILGISETFPTLKTRAKVRHFILRQFEELAQYDVFYKFSCMQLASLLEDNSLCVQSEYRLFELVIKWIRHDVTTRQNDVATLMRNIRLPLLFARELDMKASKEVIMTSNDECVKLLSEAKIYQSSIKQQPMFQTRRTQIRSEDHSIIICQDSNFEALNIVTNKCDTIGTPAPMYSPCVCVVDNFMYVCGGWNSKYGLDGRATAQCYRYDPRFEAWFLLPDMIIPRRDFVLVAFNKDLYAIGGQHEHIRMRSIERFSISTCQWKMCSTSLPEAVCEHSGALLDGRIYISGGNTVHGHLNTVRSYDPAADTWREEPSLLKQRSLHSMVECKGRLLVIGGDMGDSEVKTIEIFDPSIETWTQSKEELCFKRILGATAIDWDVFIVEEDDNKEEGSTAYGVSCYSLDKDSLYDNCYVSDSRPYRIHTRNCCSLIIRTSLFSEDDSDADLFQLLKK